MASEDRAKRSRPNASRSDNDEHVAGLVVQAVDLPAK